MELSNNKILITGGNKGIGLALAKKFLTLSNQVIITGRNETDLSNVKKQFPEVFTFQCDMANLKDLDKLSHYIKNDHPDLNILITNAGIQYNYLLTDLADLAEGKQLLSKIDYETKVNFLAPVKLTALLLPMLNSNYNSAVVIVSSALGIVPKRDASIYCANKAGLHSFSQSLRKQLTKIKVFEIIPSLVDTAMTKGRGKGKIAPEELVEEFLISFRKNKYEINIGKVKLLRFLHRVSPKMADKIINKQT